MHTSSNEPDLHIIANLEWIEKRALIAVAAVAGGVLLLWAFPAVAAFAPAGWSRMRAVTAGGLLLAVVSLALSAPGRSQLALRLSMIPSFILMPLLVAALFSYSGLVQFHPERWPLRPSPHTAIAFALAATCLLLIRQSRGGLSRLADIGAVAFAAFVLFLFGSNVFDVVEFVGIDRANLTSPQTLFCLALLAFVMVSRRAAEGGLLAILVNTGIGSQIARKVLPGVIAVPFVAFAMIVYLDRSGLVTTAHSEAVAAPLIAVLTLAVMAWMGRHTNDLELQVRLQSLTDQLTGILNRRGFDTVSEYVMRNAERAGTTLIAFFFDLDELKRANDEFGHDAGSLLIQSFADLLVVTFRKSDVVARIGGDEFVVLASGPSDSAKDVLARLARVVDACNASGILPSPISYSAGYAELAPGASGRVEDLVAEADRMMYTHKSRKKAA
jgi:diguanylate cyclase (GGDEF)-like protein